VQASSRVTAFLVSHLLIARTAKAAWGFVCVLFGAQAGRCQTNGMPAWDQRPSEGYTPMGILCLVR
jgi:hypothetical protein